jgi:hypothetical protein
MTETTVKIRSAFNECLIMATICGRSLLQIQQYHISKAYGDMSMRCDQRKWLENLLAHRLQLLSQCYPSPHESFDPLLLFAHILGQAIMIYFCKGMADTAMDAGDSVNADMGCVDYHNLALGASSTVIQFASALRELPFSKV